MLLFLSKVSRIFVCEACSGTGPPTLQEVLLAARQRDLHEAFAIVVF